MERRGLVIVHTGDGKGKTTAALGLALRAFGAGLKVLILQFIKGKKKSGELKAVDVLKNFSPTIEVKQCGLGYHQRKFFRTKKICAVGTRTREDRNFIGRMGFDYP